MALRTVASLVVPAMNEKRGKRVRRERMNTRDQGPQPLVFSRAQTKAGGAVTDVAVDAAAARAAAGAERVGIALRAGASW